MDPTQNSTNVQTTPETDAEYVERERKHKWALDQYITFCASSGLAMTEDGEVEPMSATKFAVAVGVDRTTLYWWQKNVPGFWKAVDKRAKEIFNHQTKYAIIKGLKLKAMAGDVKAAEMLWSHFGDYTPPAQKHEVKLNGWADVVREARRKKIKSSRPVEAQVVQQPQTLSTNPQSYPQPVPTATHNYPPQTPTNNPAPQQMAAQPSPPLVHSNVPIQPQISTPQDPNAPPSGRVYAAPGF
jgi:hypothetical protein